MKRYAWITVIAVAIVFCLLFGAGIVWFVSQPAPERTINVTTAVPTEATLTPFPSAPQKNFLNFLPIIRQKNEEIPEPQPTIVPYLRIDEFDFYGIRHNLSQEIALKFNSELGSITLDYIPIEGNNCPYGRNLACVYTYGQTIHMFVHSGLFGGDAENLRASIEGTLTRNSLTKIDANILTLSQGSYVYSQGPTTTTGQIAFVVKVRPEELDDYFTVRPQDRLGVVSQIHPEIQTWVNSETPLLLIETCLWNHPDETDYPWLTRTTGAILLVGLTR